MIHFLVAAMLLCRVSLAETARGDVAVASDVTEQEALNNNNKNNMNNNNNNNRAQVVILREEVKKLRRTFNRFKKGGGPSGKIKLCESASQTMSDKISLELSGLRSQLHTSDSVKSLSAELQYGLAALRSELDNKVTSVRAELDTGLVTIRSVLQSAVAEVKSEVNADLADLRAELQYSVNTACSGEKVVTAALSDLQASIQNVKSDVDNRVATVRAELEQKVMGVRSSLEGSMMGVRAQFKTDVVVVRADLQDMVADVRTEVQDSLAGTRSELQTGFMAAQSGLQNSLQSLRGDLVDLAGKAKTDVATLKAEVSGAGAVLRAELEGKVTETRTHVLQSLRDLDTDLGSQLQDLASKVQLIAASQSHLSYNSTVLRQDLDLLRAAADRSLADLKDDADKDVQALASRLDDAVLGMTSELQRQTAQTLSDASGNVTAVDQRLDSLQTDLDLRIDGLRGDFEVKVAEVATQLQKAEKQVSVEAETRGRRLDSLASNLTAASDRLEQQLQGLEKNSSLSRGSAFTRWGRSACTDLSELVYKGVVGGSSYDADGAAANRLCLTLEPQAGNVTGARTYIYGAEYKFSEHHDMDVVCAVCRTPLPTTIMVPGTHSCPPGGWTPQYTGHLTAGMVGHRAASEYLCLDSNPEHRPGSQEIRNGALFYYVFTECGSLPCPPYANMYVTCVVCSR